MSYPRGTTMARRKDTILLQAGLAAVATFFVALFADIPWLRLATKPLPVVLLIAWLAPFVGRDGRLIALGLALSMVGDVCLELSPSLFLPGLVAFLLAHVAYIAAYVGRTTALHLARLVPVALYCFLVFRWLEPSLGAMRGPVIAYVVVIAVMVWRAFAQLGERPQAPGRAWAAALGAASFALSDTLVAYSRFIASSLAIKVALMILYWGAQWAIAASAERDRE